MGASLEDMLLHYGLKKARQVYNECVLWWLDDYKNDDRAFIFTLKNPHGVEPTRFMKKRETKKALFCNPEYGPSFGTDLVVSNLCSFDGRSYIMNNRTSGYECHPQYESSLFVKSQGQEKKTYFAVAEYEVYTCN